MNAFLYDSPILPSGFRLAQTYVDLAVKNLLPDLSPWRFLAGDMATSLSYYGSLLQKFPGKTLVPFAIIQDESGIYNDGWVVLACFDGEDKSGDPAVLIYDYFKPKIKPWENKSYNNFTAWLEAARRESDGYQSSLR